jgi:hypothetical protein
MMCVVSSDPLPHNVVTVTYICAVPVLGFLG